MALTSTSHTHMPTGWYHDRESEQSDKPHLRLHLTPLLTHKMDKQVTHEAGQQKARSCTCVAKLRQLFKPASMPASPFHVREKSL